MHMNAILKGAAAAALLVTLAACGGSSRDGTAGNPPSTATQRAYDRATASPATPVRATITAVVPRTISAGRTLHCPHESTRS